MSIPDSGDRRRAPRVSTDLSGTIDGNDAVTCSVKNLSKTGALAVSSHALDEMSMVQISVKITDDDGTSENFACEAAVVRCESTSSGTWTTACSCTPATTTRAAATAPPAPNAPTTPGCR